ncbi:unnamed protein product [Pipistrellus nathusii]|uniref:Uncharacterized protein n=1 Tax=Pipistrellus nathusii TaxID=59473 RepID=A0ABN9ZP58_PIPNA
MSSPLGHACRSLYDFVCPFPPLGLRNPRVSSNGFMIVLKLGGVTSLPLSIATPTPHRATCKLRPLQGQALNHLLIWPLSAVSWLTSERHSQGPTGNSHG